MNDKEIIDKIEDRLEYLVPGARMDIVVLLKEILFLLREHIKNGEIHEETDKRGKA